MNHLSTNDILQFLDETTVNGDRRKVLLHLDQCSRCRQELELYRKVNEAAHRAPLLQVPSSFTSRIMAVVAPSTKHSLSRKLLDNLGYFLGMGLVLTIISIVLTHSSSLAQQDQKPTQLSQVMNSFSNFYNATAETVKKEYSRLFSKKIQLPASNTGGNVLLLTFGTLLALIMVDRFVLQRFYRMNHR
ncbi:MAG: hypothetical protein V1799_03005 [bacterium]